MLYTDENEFRQFILGVNRELNSGSKIAEDFLNLFVKIFDPDNDVTSLFVRENIRSHACKVLAYMLIVDEFGSEKDHPLMLRIDYLRERHGEKFVNIKVDKQTIIKAERLFAQITHAVKIALTTFYGLADEEQLFLDSSLKKIERMMSQGHL